MFIFGLFIALIIGVTLGLLGGGGSILTVPTLRYAFNQPGELAIAGSMLIVAVTSAVGVVPHARAGRVAWRVGLLFGGASTSSAFVVGRLAKQVDPTLRLVAFAAVMLVTATAMLRKAYAAMAQAQRTAAASTSPTPSPNATGQLLLKGLGVGALTGFVGAGGGFLVVPALTLLAGLSMPQAIGTSLLIITLNSTAGFLGGGNFAALPWATLGAVTGLAIIGSMLGSRLVKQVPADLLREVFGWFVVVMGVFVACQEVPKAFGHVLPLSRTWPWVLPTTLASLALAIATAKYQRVRLRRNHATA